MKGMKRIKMTFDGKSALADTSNQKETLKAFAESLSDRLGKRVRPIHITVEEIGDPASPVEIKHEDS